jgi:hypothetical protein
VIDSRRAQHNFSDKLIADEVNTTTGWSMPTRCWGMSKS